jgi:hypothetical protein
VLLTLTVLLGQPAAEGGAQMLQLSVVSCQAVSAEQLTYSLLNLELLNSRLISFGRLWKVSSPLAAASFVQPTYQQN